MWTVYAITSEIKNYIYVGLTSNLEERLKRHNGGREKTTRSYRPFQLLYSELYNTRIEARIAEKRLKSGYGKEFLKTLKNK